MRLWLMLLSGCSLTTIVTQGRSHAQLEGSLQVEGLAGQVTVDRDEAGIPHIRAASEADAAFGLGFVHGQDRMFQMDVARRMAFGELSPLLGERTADLDLFMQALDLRGRATASMAALDPNTRFVLAAYAAGVNASQKATKVPPVEHRLLDQRHVQEWTAVDCLAVVFLNSWLLSTNLSDELMALLLRNELGREELDALLRLDEAEPRTDAYWTALQKARVGELTASTSGFLEMTAGLPDAGASNAWVVGPERSADGSPILANDPHLPARIPSTWYVVDYAGGGVHAAGGTLPGMPFVITGHNDTLAWGVTNAMADYVDLVVLERDGQEGYFLEGEARQLEKREVSTTWGEDGAATATIYVSEVGPILTELAGDHIVAMRWSALELEDQTADFLARLSRTATVEEVLEAGSPRTPAVLNMVFADNTGDYAVQVMGAVPSREAHTGRVPYPGSSEHHGWDGWLEALPGERAPERGFVVAANSVPGTEEGQVDPYSVSTHYIPSWRQQRITQLIEATPKHSIESFGAIQADQLDLHARARKQELLLDLDPKTEGAQDLMKILRDWDDESSPLAQGPLVWAELQEQVARLALEEPLGRDGLELYFWAASPGRSVLDTQGALEHFFPDPDAGLRSAMLETHKALVAAYGEESSEWKWGDVHTLLFKHPFGVSVFDAGPLEVGGSNQTVNPGGYSWSRGYDTSWIGSLRLIVPLSDVGSAQIVHPPGQSGQPGAEHYEDLLRSWSKGKRVPLWFHDGDVQRNSRDTLVLSP